jgi:hypothetical protein
MIDLKKEDPLKLIKKKDERNHAEGRYFFLLFRHIFFESINMLKET